MLLLPSADLPCCLEATCKPCLPTAQVNVLEHLPAASRRLPLAVHAITIFTAPAAAAQREGAEQRVLRALRLHITRLAPLTPPPPAVPKKAKRARRQPEEVRAAPRRACAAVDPSFLPPCQGRGNARSLDSTAAWAQHDSVRRVQVVATDVVQASNAARTS